MSMKTIDDLRAADLNRLDVYVNGKRVALLAKEYPNFVLTYIPEAGRDDFVSITMPVRAESWVSEGKMHPFFETNLPEGARRQLISETFGKAMASEDMSLLALVGSDTIGRVQIVPEGWGLDWREKMTVDIDHGIPDDSARFFDDALKRYSAQGVSGVQPKLLASDERVTMRTNGWIIKRDGADTPWLSMNEYLSMRAAKASGMEVADCKLSADGRALFVERFDDAHTGFEDFCGILGLSAVEKYSGSIERMAKVAGLLVSDKLNAKRSILKSVAFNLCIGNSDAHLKNFGVVYTNAGDVKLSPFYDLVSVRAFDEFAHDIPSLTLNGKKTWTLGKSFGVFSSSLGFSTAETNKILSEVENGVKDTIPEVIKIAGEHPEFREHAKHMIASWTTGLRRLHGEKINDDDFSALPEFGMSGPKFTGKLSVKSKCGRTHRSTIMGAH